MAKNKIKYEASGSVEDINLAERAQLPSKYDSLIEDASALNHKQTLTIPVARNDDVERARLRIRQALNRYILDDVRAIKRFEVRKTDNRSIVIVAILKSRDS